MFFTSLGDVFNSGTQITQISKSLLNGVVNGWTVTPVGRSNHTEILPTDTSSSVSESFLFPLYSIMVPQPESSVDTISGYIFMVTVNYWSKMIAGEEHQVYIANYTEATTKRIGTIKQKDEHNETLQTGTLSKVFTTTDTNEHTDPMPIKNGDYFGIYVAASAASQPGPRIALECSLYYSLSYKEEQS